jgi:hypothetical protein
MVTKKMMNNDELMMRLNKIHAKAIRKMEKWEKHNIEWPVASRIPYMESMHGPHCLNPKVVK